MHTGVPIRLLHGRHAVQKGRNGLIIAEHVAVEHWGPASAGARCAAVGECHRDAGRSMVKFPQRYVRVSVGPRARDRSLPRVGHCHVVEPRLVSRGVRPRLRGSLLERVEGCGEKTLLAQQKGVEQMPICILLFRLGVSDCGGRHAAYSRIHVSEDGQWVAWRGPAVNGPLRFNPPLPLLFVVLFVTRRCMHNHNVNAEVGSRNAHQQETLGKVQDREIGRGKQLRAPLHHRVRCGTRDPKFASELATHSRCAQSEVVVTYAHAVLSASRLLNADDVKTASSKNLLQMLGASRHQEARFGRPWVPSEGQDVGGAERDGYGGSASRLRRC